MRHTPTESEIRALHEAAVVRVHGVRDSLILSWAEEVGPRRAEIMQLRKSHLPSTEKLGDLIDLDERWPIFVNRKGGGSKPIFVLPDLIIRTLDYIEFERSEVVNRCNYGIVGYREPDEIFLSGRSGMPLHLDSVTSIGRKIFSKAHVGNSSLHRLRARHAVRVIETMVDAIFGEVPIGAESSWVETILTKAAEEMGHTRPQSLKPYLTYVLNRKIQTSDEAKAARLASRLRHFDIQEGIAKRRLEHQAEVHRLSVLISEGRNGEAIDLLRSLTSILVEED
jgi:integrase